MLLGGGVAAGEQRSDGLVRVGTTVLARPVRRRHAPGWLRWLARAPGTLSGSLSFGSATIIADDLPLEAVAEMARRSPRGAGFLSLEPGLHRVGAGGALLSYQAWRRTAFATGGLHAAPGEEAQGLSAVRDRLADNGFRRVLLFPVARPELVMVRKSGFRSLEVGAEAVVEPSRFTLRGNRMADLRSMCNRADRAGIVGREADPEADRAALGEIYDAWAHHFPSGRSMRLLIGTPCFDRPLGRRYFIAEHGDGAIPVASITLTPGWDGAGWGLDVLARHPDAPPGAMDRLLVFVIERLAAEGAAHFSLGPCPMLEVPGQRRSGALGGFFRHLYGARWSNRLFPFQGLAYFKNKFAPRWEPVHIAGWPRVSLWGLYLACRMWGLFD